MLLLSEMVMFIYIPYVEEDDGTCFFKQYIRVVHRLKSILRRNYEKNNVE